METIADFPQGRPVSTALDVMRQRMGASMLPLDPAMGRLLAAACNLAGLSLLLLLARDPLTADTAAGFASRLCYPVSEIRPALESLCERGFLRSCTRPAPRTTRALPPAYWLSDDANTMATLRRLDGLYRAGPGSRYGLMCSLPMGA